MYIIGTVCSTNKYGNYGLPFRTPRVIWKGTVRGPSILRWATLSNYNIHITWHHLGPKPNRVSTSCRYCHWTQSYPFTKSRPKMTAWRHFDFAQWSKPTKRTGFSVMHRPGTKPVCTVGISFDISLFKRSPYAFDIILAIVFRREMNL